MGDDKLKETIQTSKDPAEVAVAAVTLARSREPADLNHLADVLKQPDFLNRLDSEADYAQPRKFLRLAAVLTELRKNGSPAARDVFVALMQSPSFVESPSRAELLLEASETLRPASPEVVAFWNRLSNPDDVYMNLLMPVLGRNGTKPAVDFYEKKIADPAYPQRKRIWWMRTVIPPHRNQTLFLDSCLNLLKGPLESDLKTSLVEVLFNFQESWFRQSTPTTCVPLAAFSGDAKAKLREIGEYALEHVTLDGSLTAAVKGQLQALKKASQE